VVFTVLSTTNKNVFPDDSHLRVETYCVVESKILCCNGMVFAKYSAMYYNGNQINVKIYCW
jgi:hypothetical protein